VEDEEMIVLDEADLEHAINAAREDTWTGLHHDDDNAAAEEYGENQDERGNGEGADAEGEDLQDSYDDDDSNDDENGLSALDVLGEDFERNSIANGELMHHDRTSTQLTMQYSWKFNRARYVHSKGLFVQS
jgi:hypothetical protein